MLTRYSRVGLYTRRRSTAHTKFIGYSRGGIYYKLSLFVDSNGVLMIVTLRIVGFGILTIAWLTKKLQNTRIWKLDLFPPLA
jgi:hypothetical protein